MAEVRHGQDAETPFIFDLWFDHSVLHAAGPPTLGDHYGHFNVWSQIGQGSEFLAVEIHDVGVADDEDAQGFKGWCWKEMGLRGRDAGRRTRGRGDVEIYRRVGNAHQP